MPDNRLGRLLKLKRVAMLMTLEELATACGIPVVELSRIEDGETVPQNGCFERVAQALGSAQGRLADLIKHETDVRATDSEATLALILPECDKSHLHDLHLGLR